MDLSGDKPEQASPHGLKILAIHGDGLQGLAIISVIDELCSRISSASESNKSQLPSELFDIICGTGIGALIATLLGRYRLDIPKCKQVYMDLSDYLEEKNASRRSPLKEIRQEDVQSFLNAIIRDEGWLDSMNFPMEDIPAGRRHFVLASKYRHHGDSTMDVFHGANVLATSLKSQKSGRDHETGVSLRTAQAVAHPVQALAAESSQDGVVVSQYGQNLHEIVSVAVRHARTFCSQREIVFMANIGPSTPVDNAALLMTEPSDSPGKWVAQLTSPITSPIKTMFIEPIKATLKTLSDNQISHPTQQSRRGKSISVLQWPIQGLGFSFEHSRSPVTEAKHETEPVLDPAPTFDIGGRLFNFSTASEGLTGSDSDMADLKETRVDIRHMISFMHASGLFEEAVGQYQSG